MIKNWLFFYLTGLKNIYKFKFYSNLYLKKLLLLLILINLFNFIKNINKFIFNKLFPV